jgi:pimeloyl-ACP methyl ester carboxylesterase
LVARLISESSFRKSFSAIFGKATPPSDRELHDFWSLLTYNDGVKVSHKIIRYMHERKTYRARWVGVLQKTAVPLRLINGAVDPVSGAHVVARYRELVPNPDVVVLEAIGHYPQIEDPVRVTEAFFDFVNSRM